MLIEFRVTNFRSFRDAQVFSLAAGAATEYAETNTFHSGLRGFGPFLRSAAIYGPNAAGKTNLLRAVQFMQQLVLTSAAIPSSAQTAYTPYKLSSNTRQAPSEFQITFAEKDVRYEYGFALTRDRVEKEWLIEYAHSRGRTMFHRNYNQHTKTYDWKYSPFLKGQRALWSDATRPDALFLSTAIQLNNTQLLPVFEWFQKRLVVIAGVVTMNPTLTVNLLEQPDGKKRLLPFLQEADLGIADLSIQREGVPAGGMIFGGSPDILLHQRAGQTSPDLVKVTMSHWDDEQKEMVGIDFADESSGTRLLFRTAGAWLNVIENGEVLLFDEIDTSLHPLLTRFLIQKFHSHDTNKRNAQLVFSTHNTSLLSQDLLRRDQIWFVEKDIKGASKLYPLTDFSPRNDEALERGYMRGRYGALPILPSETQG
jgi:AAA15 family ATPase/GTPase